MNPYIQSHKHTPITHSETTDTPRTDLSHACNVRLVTAPCLAQLVSLRHWVPPVGLSTCSFWPLCTGACIHMNHKSNCSIYKRCTYMYVYMYACMYVQYVCMYTQSYTYACTHNLICMHVNTILYVCMHTHDMTSMYAQEIHLLHNPCI